MKVHHHRLRLTPLKEDGKRSGCDPLCCAESSLAARGDLGARRRPWRRSCRPGVQDRLLEVHEAAVPEVHLVPEL